MSWSWRYEQDTGQPTNPPGAPAVETFPTQGDAESWLGETWRELADAGVAQVSLFEDGRLVYGPMGLSPAD